MNHAAILGRPNHVAEGVEFAVDDDLGLAVEAQ